MAAWPWRGVAARSRDRSRSTDRLPRQRTHSGLTQHTRHREAHTPFTFWGGTWGGATPFSPQHPHRTRVRFTHIDTSEPPVRQTNERRLPPRSRGGRAAACRRTRPAAQSTTHKDTLKTPFSPQHPHRTRVRFTHIDTSEPPVRQTNERRLPPRSRGGRAAACRRTRPAAQSTTHKDTLKADWRRSVPSAASSRTDGLTPPCARCTTSRPSKAAAAPLAPQTTLHRRAVVTVLVVE